MLQYNKGMSSVTQPCEQCRWRTNDQAMCCDHAAIGGHLPVACSILDSVLAGIFTIDLNWRITSFNHEAERITGVTRCESIGAHWADVVRECGNGDGCALEQAMHTGEPVLDRHAWLIDTRGRRVPVRVSAAVLHDGDGRLIGGVQSFHDLSVVEELRKRLESSYTFEDIVGRSARMKHLFNLLPVVSPSDSTVLIEGASGTGKELVARAIHHLSPRKDRQFVAINCGALPDSLLESELFGYKKGAFTDARQDKPGRFALAEGGTVFLDEIGDVSPAMQARLLRVLQERVYEPLGAVRPIRTDVRIIAATNKNLHKLVQHGVFRDDLFYRLDVIRLELPGLSERREDIPLLIDYFIHRFNRLQEKCVAGMSEEAMAVLLNHDYPGNVRELENIIEHAFVLCRGGQIEITHLPSWLCGAVSSAVPTSSMTLEQMERVMIVDALRRHHGNRQAASHQLGIHPSTLFRKLKSLDIAPPDHDGRSRDDG